MPYVAGIDLGTTYSAAAIVGPDGLVAVDLGTRAMVVPSVVAVRADGEVLTGEAAERWLVLEPSRAAREFKRRLGDPSPLLLGGVPYGAESLSGHLLGSIVRLLTEREGQPPAIVGLSHPANYGDYKLGLLEEAARVAETPVVVFVPEPVAAAVHYSQSERVAAGDLIGVYDLGGGTFDASVVRSTGDGFELIGRPDGMDRFGGIDLDEAVLGHVQSFLGDELLGIDGDDPAVLSALARLRDECRSAKEALSGDTEAAIPVMLPGLHTEVRLTRSEFEDMIRPRIRETIGVLERTVSSAEIEMSDLARVLLVGGSSRIPLVGEMIRQTTGRPVGLDAHPKLTVALGTARVAQGALQEGGPTQPIGAVPTAVPVEAVPEPDVDVEAAAEAGGAAPSEPVVAEEAAEVVPIPDRVRRAQLSGRTWMFGAAALIAVIAVVGGMIFLGDGGTESGTATDTTAAATAASPVDGTNPSVGVLAFYYASYRSQDFDGEWIVWNDHGSSPPTDICCDFYPALGPYSSSDPGVLDQHFAWFEQADIGIVGYDWSGPGSLEDQVLPLVLNAAERHELDVAFVINSYDGRSVDSLVDDIAYLYDRYGDHAAFYQATEATLYQAAGPKGLFLLWDSNIGPSGYVGADYWADAIELIHGWPEGGVVLAEASNAVDASLVHVGRFDGLFNRADPEYEDFSWAAALPGQAWYVPTVLPGFAQQKSPDPYADLPRRDGAVYRDQWDSALGFGVEPSLVAIGSFNDWLAGTQIEPATGGRTSESGFTYSDYGTLGSEAYLELTADLIVGLAERQMPEIVPLRLSITSSVDWATIELGGGLWVRPTEVSLTDEVGTYWSTAEPDAGSIGISVNQSIESANTGDLVELTLDVGLVSEGSSPRLILTKGCIGVTTIEVYDTRSEEPVLLTTAIAGPADCDAPTTYPISLNG